MLVETLTVGRAEYRLQPLDIFGHQVEHALLAIDPAFVLHTEQAIEKILRNVLLRQRTLVAGPRHVAVNVFAVRFLSNADLQ